MFIHCSLELKHWVVYVLINFSNQEKEVFQGIYWGWRETRRQGAGEDSYVFNSRRHKSQSDSCLFTLLSHSVSLRVSRELIWQRRTSCCTSDNRDIRSIITRTASASAVFILVSILCKNALFKWKTRIKYVAESNSVYVYLTRESRRSRTTFITPASTSPTTRQIICTPTSDQLSLEDTWSNRKSSTLLSDLTVPVPARGEQLFIQEHSAILKWLHFKNTSDLSLLLSLLGWELFYFIQYLFFFLEPEVRELQRIQLCCTAPSTKPADLHL